MALSSSFFLYALLRTEKLEQERVGATPAKVFTSCGGLPDLTQEPRTHAFVGVSPRSHTACKDELSMESFDLVACGTLPLLFL